MTLAEFKKLKIGSKVKILHNFHSHNYPIGKIVAIASFDSARLSCTCMMDDGRIGNWLRPDECEAVFTSRNAMMKQLLKEKEDLDARIEWHKHYKDGLDAAIVIALKKAEGDSGKLRSNIYKELVKLGCPTELTPLTETLMVDDQEEDVCDFAIGLPPLPGGIFDPVDTTSA